MFYKQKHRLNQIKAKFKLQKQNRVVFLLGAGVVNIWENGATSTKILNSIINDRHYLDKEGKTSIGGIIYEILCNHYNKEDINFETIIAFVEELLNYVINKDLKGFNPNDISIIPTIYDFKKIIEEIKDYEKIGRTGGFEDDEEIFIFKSPRIIGNSFTTTENKMERLYFYNLLKNYIELINNSIKEYDDQFHICEECDNYLGKLIHKFLSKGTIIRFYTTNYDRKIPNLYGNKYKIFDGFTDEYSNETEKEYFPDPQKILTNYYCINYYNLHGSAYWEYKFMLNPLGYQFKCFPIKRTIPIAEYSPIATNPGQKLIISNIVTGYNKVQRLLISPINLFYQAFYQDIIKTDTIIVIGYALSDNQINKVLSTAFQIGNPKIIFIDKFKAEDQLRYERFKSKVASDIIGTDKFNLHSPKSKNGFEFSEDRRQYIYKNGFGEFLKDEFNWNTLF